MNTLPKLNFPAIHPRARRRNSSIEIWDSIRGMYLVLTPEEWVRQHLIAYLVGACRAAATSIVQEYPVAFNGQPQRADVVVMDREARPLLLAECKAPTVSIDEKVFAQAVRYNSMIGARYVVLTNGLKHYCFEWEAPRDGAPGRYLRRESFPDLLGR